MFIRVDRGCAHQLRPPLVSKSVDWRAPKGRLTAGGEHAVDNARRRTGCQARNSYCSPDLEDQSLEGAPSGALGWGNTGSNPRGIGTLFRRQRVGRSTGGVDTPFRKWTCGRGEMSRLGRQSAVERSRGEFYCFSWNATVCITFVGCNISTTFRLTAFVRGIARARP
jgi:hypothetical protein